MIRLLLAIFLLIPTLAFAQSQQRNPCFVNANGGCTSVGTSNPMPMVNSGGSGSTNFLTAQVSIGTSSTLTVAARTGRYSVTITNITGTQPIYCSGTTATTGNGQYIPAVAGANFTVSTSAVINCIASTSAQTVSVAEVY